MTEIPGYRTIRELGRGAAGTVYLATQQSLDRMVALKLLSPDLAADHTASERFLREGRTAARLVHRHIVGVHDVGIHEGQPYLAMEYLPGGAVSTAGVHEPQEALDIVREIALALDHAHAQGVIHRDVKPENILIRADGSRALSDFGIARQASNITLLTQEGMTAGTPHYMSPEQLQGLPLDGRSDLYGLGVVLYQLLTGKLPYQGSDAMSIGLKHLQAPIPDLPDHLARFQFLVDGLMAKDPDDRPKTGADAARMVQSVQSGALLANTEWLFEAPTRLERWRPWLLGGAGFAVIALAWAGWHYWSRPAAVPPPSASGSVAATAGTAPVQKQRSIAVLPLVNLSGNADNEYFSDGLAETLLGRLAQVPDLVVIARTSSFAFKGKSMDVRQIGKTLDATHLVEGSVQQAGERLRINVQLVRAGDGARLWSQHYDRQVEDVFEVQDQVAAEIAQAMELAIPAATARKLGAGGTRNVPAYREFLRGISALHLRRVEDMQAAVGHFERAIELDPTYAMAYALEANTLAMLDTHVGLTPAQARRREELVLQALQLDPGLGEAYIARAALIRRTDPEAAERDFKKGLALSPNYSTGYQWYGAWLARSGNRLADAVPLLEKAIVIDPLTPTNRSQLGYMLLALGRVDETERIGNRLVRDHPDFANAHGLLSLVRLSRGDLAGALREIDQQIAGDPLSRPVRVLRCEFMSGAGAHDHARACVEAMPAEASRRSEVAYQDYLAAMRRGDVAAMKSAFARMDEPDPNLVLSMARRVGQRDVALRVLRETFPEWLKNPIGKPNLNNEYDYVYVAMALLAIDDKAQARRVLEHGLETYRHRQAGSTHAGGRGWTDTMAFAMLGRPGQACQAMQQAADAGYYEGYDEVFAEPALAGLRTAPCFSAMYAKVEALAKAQVAAAEKAGLL